MGQVWIAMEEVAIMDMNTSYSKCPCRMPDARHFQHPLTRSSLSGCLLVELIAYLVGRTPLHCSSEFVQMRLSPIDFSDA